MLRNILGNVHGNMSNAMAVFVAPGLTGLFNCLHFSSNLSHYMFIVLRFLLACMQPVLLRFVNITFFTVSVEHFIKC
jgi:hypothetical protein